MERCNRRYRMGIDVGFCSDGLAAIEIDDSSDNPYEALPLDFLSIQSVIHDGGVDPSEKRHNKGSRKAVSGVARRTRRLFKQRRKRHQQLDVLLSEHGYPVAQASQLASGMSGDDPYLPWRARISLVNGYIDNDSQRKLSLTIAMRHIARHRGWRNPYSSVNTLKENSLFASSFYLEFFRNIQKWLFDNGKELYPGVKVRKDEGDKLCVEGIPQWDSGKSDTVRPTVAELLEPLLKPDQNCRFRKEPPSGTHADEFVHIGKLHQSDNCYELSRIFAMQHVSEEEQSAFINNIFDQINPKDTGAAAELVAKDDIPPHKYRASKASLAFQRYRILTTLANLRIKQGGRENRPLTTEERFKLFDYLTSEKASSQGSDLSWHDVADQLGMNRSSLAGIGGQTADGLPMSAKQPPCLETDCAIRSCLKKEKNPALRQSLLDRWQTAEPLTKEFLIELLGNVGIPKTNLSEEEQRALSAADDILADIGSLGERALGSLDAMRLPSGRAVYSIDTLEQLNQRMLEDGLGLFEARKAAFGEEFGADWRPKANPLGAPVGNPAVDRNIKIVAQWIKACERKWGPPEVVFVEHVRDGFTTPKRAQKDTKEMHRRYKANNAVRDEIVKALDEKPGSETVGKEAIRLAEVRRLQAIQRQNNCCAYCGTEIDYVTAQMDHIVPRKGAGCSNELPNLVAVCANCNASKSNTLFYVWATQKGIRDAAIKRVSTWTRDSYFSNDKQFRTFKKHVKERLEQTMEDEPLDVRSIESVAWMACELRDQIAGHFGFTGVVEQTTDGNGLFSMRRVHVVKGLVTSEARKASGLEKRLPWIGGGARKTRLDRRHHAVDAAVIAMMRPKVAQILIERDSMRRTARDVGRWIKKGEEGDWRSYQGSEEEENSIFLFWRDKQMRRLGDLLSEYMAKDRIAVSSPLRLRLGVGKAHDVALKPLLEKQVGDKLSAAAIDKVQTPALWLALTRQQDYDKETGLPANEDRHIRVHDKWLNAGDAIGFMAESESELDKEKGEVYGPVNENYAKIGNTVHHARLYRVPKLNGKGWEYAQLRVFQADLVKHRHQDLFSVDLPPQSISVRSAKPILRSALQMGTAEYLGWVVVDDEVLIDPEAALFSPDGSNKMNKFMRAFPDTRRFSITGFDTNSRLTLAPRGLSSEGLPDIDWSSIDVEKTVARTYGCHGWERADIDKINKVIKGICPLSIDSVLATLPTIIRRNALGEQRWKSDNNMPVCWKIPLHPTL